MAKYRLLLALKYFIYTVGAIVLFLFQSSPYFLSINNIRPMLLIPYAAAVTTFEGEAVGGVFALLCGLLCDFTSIMPFGINGVILLILCILSGLLFTYLFRPTLINFLFFTALITLIRAFIEYYIMYKMWGYSDVSLVLLHKLLPTAGYTVIIAPVIFFGIKFIYSRFARLLKI